MDPTTISLPDPGGHPRAKDSAALDHATQLILQVCQLAGSASFVDDARESREVASAIRNRNTAILFDWLVASLSYQGIADQVAYDYMERHGQATWQVIASDLRRAPSCPKLKSYWHFHDCQYNKTRYTCAEPVICQIARCPTIGFATAGSTRRRMCCICLFATLLAATSSAGSTGACKPPPSGPGPTGWPECEWRCWTR
jgi:hypothetical protein